jgi:hypothetical protein
MKGSLQWFLCVLPEGFLDVAAAALIFFCFFPALYADNHFIKSMSVFFTLPYGYIFEKIL